MIKNGDINGGEAKRSRCLLWDAIKALSRKDVYENRKIPCQNKQHPTISSNPMFAEHEASGPRMMGYKYALMSLV